MIGFLGQNEHQIADNTKENTRENISKDRADKYGIVFIENSTQTWGRICMEPLNCMECADTDKRSDTMVAKRYRFELSHIKQEPNVFLVD